MPFVTILSARTIVLATQDSLVMERLAKVSDKDAVINEFLVINKSISFRSHA